ncbi:MAG: ethanolamine utilization protein EutH [Lentisphaeria bacterium]|nr:ethanolamine utilization protein EutH [Lentisphaeria bacterium]
MLLIRIITNMLAVATLIGVLDRLRGNRWKLGERFDAGFSAFPDLFVVMGGVLALLPALQKLISPWVVALCDPLGVDPGLLPGIFLANDMGAFHLSHALCRDPQTADFGGMLIGGILGVNLIFTLPAAITITDKEDYPFIIKGLFCGFLAVPFGAVAGGLVLGYPFILLWKLVVPVLICTLVIAGLFLKFQKLVAAISIWSGKLIAAIALLGLTASIFSFLFQWEEKTATWLTPVREVLWLVGLVVILLPGAYVLAELLARGLKNPLIRCSQWLGLDPKALTGMIISLANSIPVFGLTGEMSRSGKVAVYAFLFGGAFSLGDHLAFCSAMKPQLLGGLLTAKLVTAFCGLIFALLLLRYERKNSRSEQGSD